MQVQVMDNPAELLATRKLLDRILHMPGNMVMLEMDDIAGMLARMRVLSIREGISIYVWTAATGLYSLHDRDFAVAGSERIVKALLHVQHATHFGVYLFVDGAAHLRKEHFLMLRRLSMRDVNGRKLVFVGNQFAAGKRVELPPEMANLFEWIVTPAQERHRLRLRDGHWER